MIGYTGDIKFGVYTAANCPLGWLLCDTAQIPTQNTALRAMVGNNTPDFRGRAPVGTGSGFPLGDTGGSTSVTLSEAQMPTHDHPFTGGSHTHSFSGSSHSHPFTGSSHGHILNNGSNLVQTGGSGGGLSFSGSSGHAVTASASNTTTGGTVGSATTSGSVASASTSGTVGNAGSGNAINVQSPYTVALAIIKV